MSDAKPPHVRFERRPVEDVQASLAAGHYVAKDVDYIALTAIGSKDGVSHVYEKWLLNKREDVKNGRITQEWLDHVKKCYQAWKSGQELPITGIPIKGWGVISPAQQETLTNMGVYTVEVLAELNDEGVRRLGMGGNEIKNKAIGWLKSLEKSGSKALEWSAMKTELANKDTEIAMLKGKIDKLVAENMQLKAISDRMAA